jgi:hypothetical protein
MERRRALRRRVAEDEPVASARLRTGGQLRFVDVSSWGALAQTSERLLPGRYLDVHVVSVQGRVLVRSRVARAYVARVDANAIEYRAALAFDRALDVLAEGYPIPVALRGFEIEQGSHYPAQALPGDIEFTDRTSA